MRFNGCWRVILVMVAVLCGHLSFARADFITSINQLQVDGSVNWGVLGPNGFGFGGPQFTELPGIPNTSLLVTGPDQIFGGFSRIDQGAGWNGSFNAGEKLIWSDVDGSFRIDFFDSITGAPAPIAGFGARYQDSLPGPFSGVLTGFDSSDNLLFTHQLSGITLNGDPLGSVPFFGSLSDERNIAYLIYDDRTTGGPLGQQGFALGTFYVQADPTPASAVPEPASILLIVSGLPVLLAARRKRVSNSATTAEVPA
jgi:hypothetical protein